LRDPSDGSAALVSVSRTAVRPNQQEQYEQSEQ
jgi:hypothetical protein